MPVLSRKFAGYSMTFFGVLDIISAFRGYRFSLNMLKGVYELNGLGVLVMLFHISLIISGVLLIRGRKEGFYLYYVQFLFRFLLAIFTFGFFFALFGVKTTGGMRFVTVICGILEVVRLLLTIRARPSS